MLSLCYWSPKLIFVMLMQCKYHYRSLPSPGTSTSSGSAQHRRDRCALHRVFWSHWTDRWTWPHQPGPWAMDYTARNKWRILPNSRAERLWLTNWFLKWRRVSSTARNPSSTSGPSSSSPLSETWRRPSRIAFLGYLPAWTDSCTLPWPSTLSGRLSCSSSGWSSLSFESFRNTDWGCPNWPWLSWTPSSTWCGYHSQRTSGGQGSHQHRLSNRTTSCIPCKWPMTLLFCHRI